MSMEKKGSEKSTSLKSDEDKSGCYSGGKNCGTHCAWIVIAVGVLWLAKEMGWISSNIPFGLPPGSLFGSHSSSLMCDPIADSIRQSSISSDRSAICSMGAHPDAIERTASTGGMVKILFIISIPCCAKR